MLTLQPSSSEIAASAEREHQETPRYLTEKGIASLLTLAEDARREKRGAASRLAESFPLIFAAVRELQALRRENDQVRADRDAMLAELADVYPGSKWADRLAALNASAESEEGRETGFAQGRDCGVDVCAGPTPRPAREQTAPVPADEARTLRDRFDALPRRRQLAVLDAARAATTHAWNLQNIHLERVINGMSDEMEKQERLAAERAPKTVAP